MKRFLSLFLALAVLTFFALFLFLPLFTVVAEGCDPAVMREVFRSRLYLQGMTNSLAVAVVTTAIVFLISDTFPYTISPGLRMFGGLGEMTIATHSSSSRTNVPICDA